MYFLQTKVVETSTNVLLNYGAIGAMLVLCVLALIFAARLFVKQSEKNNERYDALQSQLQSYIKEDREKIINVVQKNSEAFNSLEKTLERFLDRE